MIKLTKDGVNNLRRRLDNPTEDEIEATEKFFEEFSSDSINFEEKLKKVVDKLINK